jgi:hypothetical protein
VAPEIKKYYEERFSMMTTVGWRDFLEDINNLKAPLEDITTIKTVDMLYFRQGQLDILNWVLGLRDISEQTYEELNEENL